jgi:hypothetical protein
VVVAVKPSDFYLSLLDVFAVVLPGACLTAIPAVLYNSAQNRGFGAASYGWLFTATPNAAFVLGAFILGHFIAAVASYLDRAFEWYYEIGPEGRHGDVVCHAAKLVREAATSDLVTDKFSILKWSKAFIQIHDPASRLEIDRLEATSKFFRSMVVVSVPWTVLLLGQGEPVLALIGLAVGVFAFTRFCDQRWKAAQLSFATTVLVARTKVKPRATEQ